MIKAVILDLDGTLINGTTAVAGTAKMLADLKALGLRIAIASNHPDGGSTRMAKAGIQPDLLLTRKLVGSPKGSPAWVEKAVEQFGIADNEVVWLGDSDLDMRSAVNAGVVYFNAGWSKADYPYGISVKNPAMFTLIVSECFRKPINWYWTLSTTDSRQRAVAAKTMIDGNGAGIPALKSDLISFLKNSGNPKVGPLPARDFMMLHLIGSIYGDGIYRQADTWTIYPGSNGGPNKAMGPFVHLAARLFRDRYVEDLLIRHTPALDSGRSRAQQSGPTLLNQMNTMRLNDAHRDRVEGKSIVLVDDFITRGYSTECARNLLLRAGATKVICVALGKYGSSQTIVTRPKGYKWDPYTAVTHSSGAFIEYSQAGATDTTALGVVRDSYQRVAKA